MHDYTPDQWSASAAALAELGIYDGTDLLRRAYADLVEDGFRTAGDIDRIAATFRAVFAEQSGLAAVPLDVDAAIDDARHATYRLASPRDDLRTAVLPTFYAQFAGFYCAYREAPLGPAPRHWS